MKYLYATAAIMVLTAGAATAQVVSPYSGYQPRSGAIYPPSAPPIYNYTYPAPSGPNSDGYSVVMTPRGAVYGQTYPDGTTVVTPSWDEDRD